MIIGIGTDILDIRRIDGVISRHKDRFVRRIFTESEINFCQKRVRFIESLAKMFSIKEAVLKAISSTHGIFWHDIEILHDENGKPNVVLKRAAYNSVLAKSFGKAFVVEASVSDEIPYVCAFAVIQTV